MRINNQTKWEQLCSKIIEQGIEKLSDAELLAIFIKKNNKQAIDTAHMLLSKFGGIRNIFDANSKKITNIPGIGKDQYLKLIASLEISSRYLKEQLTNTNIIYDTETAYLYLTSRLRHQKREIFACLFLNSQNRVIHYEEIFFGTINNTAVYPREIAKIALEHNAAAVIFAHNHPTGTPDPSPQDKYLTSTLAKILLPLDIKVLDHIIIGNNSYISIIDKCIKPNRSRSKSTRRLNTIN